MALEFTPASSDPLQVVDVAALDEDEAAYVRAARAANTLRGYRSDWAEWQTWAADNGHADMPAAPEGITRYLTLSRRPRRQGRDHEPSLVEDPLRSPHA